jgi:aminopeptidase N
MLGGPNPGAAAGAAVLLDGTAEIAAGKCGEPVKLNLGDVGYYRVHYDDAMLAALAGAVEKFAPADRVNLIADSWAMVEAGRAAPGAFFDFTDRLAADDNRAVADAIIRIFFRIDHLQRGRPGRTAFQAYARSALQPAFRRLGWDAAPGPGESADNTLLRARVIGALGAFGDDAVIAEAKRRFAAFVKDPASLPTDLRGTIVNLAGRAADRATYDTLLALARKTTNTGERVRYYSAAAGALDPALARETLALALTEELPSSLVGTLISRVAGEGEHPDLAWSFVQANFEALATRQGPSFRNTFASNLMTNFTDAAHAAELASFAPVHETSGGRQIADRAQERIMIDAEFSARQLPAIDDWVNRRAAR